MSAQERKVQLCVVTSSRADYGYLYWLLKEALECPSVELSIIATGSHLSKPHGFTVSELEQDGFRTAARVDLKLSDDSAISVCRSIGLAVEGFSREFAKLKPDWVVVMGDRYEMMGAAQAALVHRIPVAHIGGGDTTEGAIDESIRHSITKMAHLHFVATPEAERRVRQLGEDPKKIHRVGSTAIDAIVRSESIDRDVFFREIGFDPRPKNILVTFHPETLGSQSVAYEVGEMISAFATLDDNYGIIWTSANADPGGAEVRKAVEAFATRRKGVALRASLGRRLYLNAIRHCDLVAGNSSSGIYEVPSFRKPTLNVGGRQEGRPQAASIVSVTCRKEEILAGLHRALALDCSNVDSPFGDGNASKRVLGAILAVDAPEKLLRKHFHDWSLQ